MSEKMLTNEEVDRIIALFDEGKTLDEIREEFGIPHVWGVANLIPPERKEEYRRAYRNAWERRKYRRRKEQQMERKKDGENSRNVVTETQEHGNVLQQGHRDVLQDIAKRPSPRSEIVRSEPRKAEEKTDWWKYASIALGIVVLGGVLLFALARGSKPRDDRARESKLQDNRNREPRRMRYKALADKYKVM